jgi:hypothetical protein
MSLILMTIRIMALRLIASLKHSAKILCYNIMLSVEMLSGVMLNAIMYSGIVANVIRLNVILLHVIVPSFSMFIINLLIIDMTYNAQQKFYAILISSFIM